MTTITASIISPQAPTPTKAIVRTAPAADDVWQSFVQSVAEQSGRLYGCDLRDFARWLGVDGAAAAATWLLTAGQGMLNKTFLEYQSGLRERRMAPATINRRRAALRSVLSFGRMLGLTGNTLEIKSVRHEAYRDTAGPAPDRLRGMLTELKDRAAGGNGFAARDLALAWLLYGRGLRRFEAIGLDLCHFDPKAAKVAVLGKARGDREWLTIPAAAVEALNRWIKVRGRDEGAIFVSLHLHSKKRLNIRTVGRMFKPFGIRPHGLRHAAITAALEATHGDIARVQAFSRHKNPAVLLVYDDRRKDFGGEIADLIGAEIDRPEEARP